MKQTEIKALAKEVAFKLIANDWMLVTAGTEDHFNTMTASWGGIGILWNRPVAFLFIRPERYTHEFLEANERLSLSFFTEDYRKALQLCGSKSGRDMNKVEAAGLHPLNVADGVIGFDEARLTISCRKLFQTDMQPCNILDKEILERFYTGPHGGGYHTIYVAEIEGVFEGEK